jgi:hypothetical protein
LNRSARRQPVKAELGEVAVGDGINGHMFVERLQLSPKERYEQFNRRYPGLINRVKLKYVAAFLGISIYTLSRVRAKK